MGKNESESFVRDLLLARLSMRLGRPDAAAATVMRLGFEVRPELGGGTCLPEGKLAYTLPGGRRMVHKNDILLSLRNSRQIAIEIKHLSAVTDQFKTRSYDMLHLKQTLESRVCGIMVYAHVPGNGIALDSARDICYPFDYFIGFIVKADQLEFVRIALDAGNVPRNDRLLLELLKPL